MRGDMLSFDIEPVASREHDAQAPRITVAYWAGWRPRYSQRRASISPRADDADAAYTLVMTRCAYQPLILLAYCRYAGFIIRKSADHVGRHDTRVITMPACRRCPWQVVQFIGPHDDIL